MNYIAEIRAFYDIAESLDLSSSCICLWHAIMYQANKLGWLDGFSLPISTLELRTKLSRSAIYAARNTLEQHGLISVKERKGRQSALYTINSLCLFNGHNDGRNPERNTVTTQTQTQTQPERNPELLNKQNNTEQNILEEGEAARASEVRCKWRFIQTWQENIGLMPPYVLQALEAYLQAGMEDDAIVAAIGEGIANGAGKFRYIDAILKDWKNRGVTTAEQAQAAITEWKNRAKPTGTKPSNARGAYRNVALEMLRREQDDKNGDAEDTGYTYPELPP